MLTALGCTRKFPFFIFILLKQIKSRELCKDQASETLLYAFFCPCCTWQTLRKRTETFVAKQLWCLQNFPLQVWTRPKICLDLITRILYPKVFSRTSQKSDVTSFS